jgi:hypothetical protein
MGLTYCLCFLFFQQYEWLIGSQYKSIELAKSDWVATRKIDYALCWYLI